MIGLSQTDVTVLREALDREYRCFVLHVRMIGDLGAIPPLTRIVEIEAMHISVLESLHLRYGVRARKNRWLPCIGGFDDAGRACSAAIAAENERMKHYQRFIARAHEPEILAELRNLERASRDGRLPALNEWARQLGHKHATVHRRHVKAE